MVRISFCFWQTHLFHLFHELQWPNQMKCERAFARTKAHTHEIRNMMLGQKILAAVACVCVREFLGVPFLLLILLVVLG